MSRPRLKIAKDITDNVVELLTLAGVLVSWIFPLIYYSDLPEQIPVHFSGSGVADDFGPKNFIWVLPLLGTIICGGIYRLIKFPHLFNYLEEINNSNARSNYRTSQKMLRLVNLLVAVSLAYISVKMVLTALGRSNGLSTFFLPLFTIGFLLIPLIYLRRFIPQKKQK